MRANIVPKSKTNRGTLVLQLRPAVFVSEELAWLMCDVKGKGKEAYSSSCYKRRKVPYGITQCYLPPGRGDIPAFTPAN